MSTSGKRWSVFRRYRQFYELHAVLSSYFSEELLPALPARTLVPRLDDEFLLTRLRHLDVYLQSLHGSHSFWCAELHEFLTADSSQESSALDPIEQSASGARKPDASHRYEAVLSQWRYKDVRDPTSDVLYHLEMREFYSSTEFLKWMIVVTFEDILALHSLLSSRFESNLLPDLPTQSLLQNTSDAEFTNRRARQIEVYVRKLMATSHLQSTELNAFLQLDNPNRQIATGTRMPQENTFFLP